MRHPEYLSPTSISKFEDDQTEFYLSYLAEDRPPRFPQTQPMSIGSAFDAYAKSFIYEKLFGAGHDPKFSFEALFDAQVEAHNRDWALEHGKYVFSQYQSSGALADLMTELRNAQGEPRFEFEVKGAVNGYREGVESKIGEVILLGKPDCHFTNSEGQMVVLDWKVNGYCSKTCPGPMQGYLRLRSAGKTNLGMHKKCHPMSLNGVLINIGHYLEEFNEDWARQLGIYAWLTGAPIGSEFVVAIDQIVCDASKSGLPGIRVAEHRLRVSRDHQQKVFDKACHIWDVVHSDHIFRHMSREDSIKRCEVLDGMAEALRGDGSTEDAWFNAVTRG